MADLQKIEKRIQVLKLIRKNHEISRADLARLTGLTRPTISVIVSELESCGFICETGKGESKGGKRPILLTLNSNAMQTIGIDLADEDCIRGVISNINGDIIAKHEETYENSFQSLFDKTSLIISTLIGRTQKNLLKGIGIAISGVVDERRNDVVHSSNFDIENQNLAEKLRKTFDLPVYLSNRPNAAALAEKTYGKGKRYKNLVYLTTGQGVGAGIINQSEVFSGSYGSAGEIGKIILELTDQAIPSYPNQMTLEYKTRAQYILDQLKRETGQSVKYHDMLKLFFEGDSRVEKYVFENALYLAYAASIVANLLNPEVIILGGRIKEFGPKYLDIFKQRFGNFLMVPQTDGANQTKIEVSDYGRDGIAFGGAVLVLDKVFNLEMVDL